MNTIKLLIVDDEEDNRLVLNAICKKLEGFSIEFAFNGIEAIEKVESWQPHIVLMDIMMPKMDGYEASKIIKQKYPDTVIIAVTAVNDSRIQANMYDIGINIYIHKPVDRALIRYKLQSLASAIRKKKGITESLSSKEATNPFNNDIRSFKTVFDINSSEAVMDFGIWLFDQYSGKSINVSQRYDRALELLYKIMTKSLHNKQNIQLIIEESHEEYYINVVFETSFSIEPDLMPLIEDFAENALLHENIFSLKLIKPMQTIEVPEVVVNEKMPVIEEAKIQIVQEEVETEKKEERSKETRIVNSDEKELLRQSFVNKTSAADYVSDLGGDVLEEIMDLVSVDEEWQSQLVVIESEGSVASLQHFTGAVLSSYISVINNLFEFTALAYALSTLSVFLNEHGEEICADETKLKTLVMMLELLGEDLRSWKEHVFETQSTADIHYLDSSFFSSCMQIEGIVAEKELSTDDDNDMEFF